MKKIWIIALIISASVMIASCGSSENSEQSKAESTTPAVDEECSFEKL